jgi:carbon storage regulator CsrA
MLVLSRKSREQIQIGPNITVTILRIKGGVVRVGIEAPRNMRVLRAELDFKPSLEGEVEVEAETTQPAPAMVTRRPATNRSASTCAGGKKSVTPTNRIENPLRSRMASNGAAPLMNFLARR